MASSVSDNNSNNNKSNNNTKLTRKEKAEIKRNLKLQRSEQRKIIKSYKEPALVLYCVAPQKWSPALDADRIEHNQPPLAYAYMTSQEEAAEYCDRYFFVKHYPHFKMWCRLRDKDVFDSEAWEEYSQIIGESLDDAAYYNSEDRGSATIDASDYPQNEALSCYKVTYSRQELASILRFLSLSLPVGAPWETDLEISRTTRTLGQTSPFYKEMLANLAMVKADYLAYAQEHGEEFASDQHLNSKDEDNNNDDDLETDIFA